MATVKAWVIRSKNDGCFYWHTVRERRRDLPKLFCNECVVRIEICEIKPKSRRRK